MNNVNGYDPEFLGKKFKIDIPWINYEVFADVLKSDDLRKNYIADYLHYSVVMSKKNRQAYLSACNLDQTQYRSVSGRNWFCDSRIGPENQLDNRYYKGEENFWDRGHLTRRTAVTWGDSDYIARKASNDSCSYANACLQHRFFNEDEWRIPEKIAQKFDRDLNGRLSIMTGPLFTENDRWFTPNDYDVPPGRVPSGFWKIVYYIDKKKTEAAGEEVLGCEAYLVYQDNLSMHDKVGADSIEIDTLQVTISELTDLTGIEFPRPLYDANPLWYYRRDDREIEEPERYEIKVAAKSKGVRKNWEGHVIHERDDISKHGFKRVSR
jgi:endonuclease G